ncbi:MAG: uroporphyrinogen-III C-methyltransferase [Verrucomicrobia bacterium]|nr:uroporphyrinogen-III C-methyltransferase [Verrucomicrobiota bacterium]
MSQSARKSGICYIIGAGPGDPGLLTLRGRECLEGAEVVFYDYLCNPQLLRHAPGNAQSIFVGKNSKGRCLKQEEINALLVRETAAGKIVCRLKGGDPYVFGRGGEEALALADAGLSFEVVPGISSAVAAPAFAGIPVTHRGLTSSFTVITGHEDPTKPQRGIDWKQVAQIPGTKVILMGVGRMREIAGALIEAGMPSRTPIALVCWGTYGRQKTVAGTLATIVEQVEAAVCSPPGVTVIGEVVNLREQLDWFESRPLFGKRIVVTRTREQASELSRRLRQKGADVLELPTIRFAPPEDTQPLQRAIRNIHEYDWIVFTSSNAVETFLREFLAIHRDIRKLGTARIAAVGPATVSALRRFHLEVNLQPEEYTAGKMAEAFAAQGKAAGMKILLPRGDLARKTLTGELAGQGAICDEVETYRTVPEIDDLSDSRYDLLQGGADWITFASSSAAENFHALGLPLEHFTIKYASIGPLTSEKMRQLGCSVDVEAKEHTIPGLVEAIVAVETGD